MHNNGDVTSGTYRNVMEVLIDLHKPTFLPLGPTDHVIYS
jgi:hypothetical protein